MFAPFIPPLPFFTRPVSKPDLLHRTDDQIRAQLEARLAELEAEAESAQRLYPCEQCRFFVPGVMGGYCSNALVKGFEKNYSFYVKGFPALCGLERVLWEPKQSWIVRFWNWLNGA